MKIVEVIPDKSGGTYYTSEGDVIDDEEIIENIKKIVKRRWINEKRNVRYYMNEDKEVVMVKMHNTEVVNGLHLELVTEVTYGMKFIQLWELMIGGTNVLWIVVVKDMDRIFEYKSDERLVNVLGKLILYLVEELESDYDEIGKVIRDFIQQIDEKLRGDIEWEV